MKRVHSVVVPAVLSLLLGACGGGGYEEPPVAADPLSEVPASASQSSAALVSYVGVLATLPAESRDPVALGTFAPGQPDDSEPEPVDG